MVNTMAMDIARQVADNIIEGSDVPPGVRVSSDTFTKDLSDENKTFMQSSVSSYTLADDRSQFSRDVDAWMAANTSTESTAIQGSRVPLVQRSVLARSSSLDRTGLCYALAMILPLFSLNTCPHWSCSPGSQMQSILHHTRPVGRIISSAVINTAEFCLTHFFRVFTRARAHIRQLAQDQVARELFATAMDIVLVIYAIGFLILSLYQASIFG